jgi:uncharacterized protein GlcG (DUF336 family)
MPVQPPLRWIAAALASLLGLGACDFGTPAPTRTAAAEPGVAAGPDAPAPSAERNEGCEALPGADELRRLLRAAPDVAPAGGLFDGRRQWGALVDRGGRLCAVAVATDDPAAAWPGSRAIAMAKAYTANAFSTDAQPLSTARLYTLAQPGHSLFGLAAGNPFDPECLASPDDASAGEGRVCGGTITFGGGLALYREGVRVGGLGVSGDTACADHEIAKRVRQQAGLDPAAGAAVDDITYASADGASAFSHPLCANTFRNGQKVGDESAAAGY